MVDIIIKGGDDRPNPRLPNHVGETERYDHRVAQDHTGIQFNARPRQGYKSGDPLTDCTVLMTKPSFLQCPGCNGTDFRIIADDSHNASGGLVQFVCARGGCRTFWPLLQIGQPQVNDIMARRMGLIVPEKPRVNLMDLIMEDDDS